MTKPFVRTHNVETNEIVDREMTDSEFAIYQAENAMAEEQKTLAMKKIADRAALLQKLGLTAEDLQALGLGGN